MANGKTKQNKYRNVEILGLKKTWRQIVGGPLGDGEKKTKISGYAGSNLTFSATHHAAQREVQECRHSRVWINRARLPFLLVVN